jgi:3-deoxy-D-manno-octulosonic-acid transferase
LPAETKKTDNRLELLYTALLYIIQPLVWLRLLLRSRKAPAYRKRWAERYGYCRNKVAPDGILLHSVSVGETLAAIRWFAPCATVTRLCRSPSPP